MMIDENRGQTNKKPSPIEDVLIVIEKEIALLHEKIDQLTQRLTPVRRLAQEVEPDKTPECVESDCSPVISELSQLLKSVSVEKNRLEVLLTEIQV